MSIGTGLAVTAVTGDHDTAAFPGLQTASYRVHPDDHVPGPDTQAEQTQHAAHEAGFSPSAESSAVRSARNAINSSAAAGVIPGILSMTSRSKSRMSLRVR